MNKWNSTTVKSTSVYFSMVKSLYSSNIYLLLSPQSYIKTSLSAAVDTITNLPVAVTLRG